MFTAGALLAAGAFLAAPAPALALPAATTPVQVWQEDFDNIYPTQAVALTEYTGLNSELYTAAADWLPPASGGVSRCNGWVLGAGSVPPAADAQCGVNGGRYVISTGAGGTSPLNAWGFLRRMAAVMGMAQGIANNSAVASLTNGTGATQNQTTTLQLSIADTSYPGAFTPEPGHFYVASALFAAIHCSADAPYSGATPTWNDPQENIHLMANGVRVGALQTASNICPAGLAQTTPPRAYIAPALHDVVPVLGYYPYPDSPNNTGAGNIFIAMLYSEPYLVQLGDRLGLEINNTQLSGAANDVAFDKLRILDATPTLYKSFHATQPDSYLDGSIAAGSAGTLTFIIVNTTDKLEKTGWSFTDQLPAGLTIASPANVQSDCAAATVDVTAGDAIKVENGSIAKGAATCSISVNVMPAAAGVYANDVNDPAAVTMTGLFSAPGGPAKLYVGGIQLTKSAAVTTGASATEVRKAGDVITYTFTLTNTAPVGGSAFDLSTLVWNDSMTLTTPIGNCKVDGAAPPPATLTGGKGLICTATYEVTQADINAIAADPALVNGLGQITNTVNASVATNPTGDAGNVITLVPLQAQVDVPVYAGPALTLDKTVNKTVLPGAGTTVTYTITITNSGNTSLNGVELTDTFSNGATPAASCSKALPTSMQPLEVITCNVNYTVAPTDTGTLGNTAKATSDNPNGGNRIESNEKTVTLGSLGAKLLLTKSAAVTTGASATEVNKAGDVITYTFTLKNDGPANAVIATGLNGAGLSWFEPLANPADSSIGDGFTGSPALAINCTGMPATLAYGESGTCKATYTVTQADIDNSVRYQATGGKIMNTNATVTANAYPANEQAAVAQFKSNTATVNVPVRPDARLKLTKTADKTTLPDVGQTITYTVTITNDGNETLYAVDLTDTFSGGALVMACTRGGASVTLPLAELPPGGEVICTATHTVTAADMAAGTLKNTAQASSQSPLRTVSVNSSPDSANLSRAVTGTATTPIPALDARGLTVLALMLGALAFWVRRGRRR